MDYSNCLNYYKSNGKGKTLKELLNDSALNDKFPNELKFFKKVKFPPDGNEGKFSGKLLAFTQNETFEKYVKNILGRPSFSFPTSDITTIKGRVAYINALFEKLVKTVTDKHERSEPKFQLILMYISKVGTVCSTIHSAIKETTAKQRMAGETLEELQQNLQRVEPLIRKDLQKTFGANLDASGFKYSIKQTGSIVEKIRKAQETYLKDEGYTDLEACKSQVIDAIRYTVLYDIDDYLNGYLTSVKELKNDGYQLIRCINFWKKSGAYNGLNTLFASPYGYFVEIQFHTPESKSSKFAMHKLYEEQRNIDTTEQRKAEIEKEMSELSKQYAHDEKLVEQIKKLADFEASTVVWSLPPK